MSKSEVYTVKVEEGRPATATRPAVGPVYRSIYAKDGLLELPEGLSSPWQFFSETVKRLPECKLLGRRETVESKVSAMEDGSYRSDFSE